MKEEADRVILGLDPGTAFTGYGVLAVSGNSLRAVEYGVVATVPELSPEQRLARIFQEMEVLLDKHRPSATAVESLFFNTNVQTALAVGQARGVALLACARAGCAVFEYTPQQVKQAVVGYGKAGKEQVMEMVRLLLGLPEVPRPDHAADALAVAICHANTCGLRERLAQTAAAAAPRTGRGGRSSGRQGS
jgi:crossover junction endodeoxyribonuclease RuvC